ncbi:hypothetical protein INT44_000695 [Umbelopsis vinacea]|uniref:WRKY domain-containing protein n=1 Tax=Umbelopsis vinacea TaxID=44442 RepID=A0A8H7Q9D3_9FUNG|nr:hypothetical protein INT44_000695 [Umbelopsis vinacea]
MPPSLMSSPMPSEPATTSQPYRAPLYVDPLGESTTPQHTPYTQQQSSSFALQDVVHQFRDKPELLQLILQSKVEEDKRRAEEAKLRAKEIDLYMQQRDSQGLHGLALRPIRFKSSDAVHPYHVDNSDTTPKSSGTTSPALLQSQEAHTHTPTHTPTLSPYGRLQPSPPRTYSTSREHTPGPRHLDYRRHSAVELPPFRYNSPNLRHESSSSENDLKRRRLSMDQAIGTSSPLSPPADHSSDANASVQEAGKRQRKRREMQSITKVVETRDFPYNDEYLWKNNGNTVHKGSGEKSIYYKCSNSSKGCPVNKTVTFKKNGEYVIKYRGEHLDDCNRVKRIVDV